MPGCEERRDEFYRNLSIGRFSQGGREILREEIGGARAIMEGAVVGTTVRVFSREDVLAGWYSVGTA
jgi:hypothetical protein